MHNHLQRDVQLSLQTVVSTLAGFPERYVSHKPVSLCTIPFLALIEQDDRERGNSECEYKAAGEGAPMGEQFRTVKMDSGGRVVTNLRLDYELRPDGLDDCCLYDFVMCWQKDKRCAKAKLEMTHEEASENGLSHNSHIFDGTALFQFRSPHPQRDAWGLRFRPNYSSFVPVITGPLIRDRQKHPGKFARQVLLLFKPFRNIRDLRGEHEHWTDALQDFEINAPRRIRYYISNLEAMEAHRVAWEQDMDVKDAERTRKAREHLFEADFVDTHSDDDVDADTIDVAGGDDKMPGPAALKQFNLMPFSAHEHDVVQRQLYNAAIKCAIFDTTSHQCVELDQATDDLNAERKNSSQSSNNWFSRATDSDVEHAETVQAALDRLARCDLPSAPQCTDMPDPDKHNASQRTRAHGPKPPKPPTVVQIEDISSDAVAQQFRLNAKQRIAFQFIADTFLEEIACIANDDLRTPSQLLLYIGGPGGTGKSTVIRAVQKLFELHGHSEWLKTCGPTGTAAFNVGGSTVFSLFGISWSKKTTVDAAVDTVANKQASRSKTAGKLRNTKFVIIDEISMVGASTFAAIDASIKAAKGGSADDSWGGLHVIAFGDFCQLKPIRKASLFSNKTANPHRYQMQLSKELSLNGGIGRQLWLEFNKVVFLTELMRQRHDPAHGALLDRLRAGKSTCCCRDALDLSVRGAERQAIRADAPVTCTRAERCDYHTVMSRCLHPASAEAQDPKWKSARLITHSNPVSAAWNRDVAAAHAAQTGQPILVSVAQDERPERCKPLTAKQQRALLRLPDSDTASRLSALPLVVGMRVILRVNLQTQLGLVNGAEGTVVSVRLNPLERLPADVYPTGKTQLPRTYHLRFLPVYVVVRFDKLALRSKLNGVLHPRDVMIAPKACYFQYSKFSGSKWTIKRTQLPLTPCQSMTVPLVQGKTLDPLIVDLNIDDAHGHKMTQLYVMLSRGQQLANLRLLRPFHHRQLHRTRDTEVLHEEKRLLACERATLAAFYDKYPDFQQSVTDSNANSNNGNLPRAV